ATRSKAPRGPAVGYGPHRTIYLTGIHANGKVARASARRSVFFRRRHQARKPPQAKIRPGSPAPAIGPGKTGGLANKYLFLPHSMSGEGRRMGVIATPSRALGTS